MRTSSRGAYRRSTRRGRSVRGYTLRGRNNRILYAGVTNNPSRRAAQHRRDGKAGKMKVETRHPFTGRSPELGAPKVSHLPQIPQWKESAPKQDAERRVESLNGARSRSPNTGGSAVV